MPPVLQMTVMRRNEDARRTKVGNINKTNSLYYHLNEYMIMKKKLMLIVVLAAIINSSLYAQDWQATGNSLTQTGLIGTTNAQDIKFISNNIPHGMLTKDGLWGLGTDFPDSKMHVNSFTGQDGLRVQISGSTKLLVSSNGGVSAGTSFVAPPNGLVVAGNTGIGTISPLSRLHVRNGNAGFNPFFQSVITAESADNAYVNLLSPSQHETGILFGNNSSSVSGGIIYNSAFQGSAPNALQFRTNGNFPRMVLTAEGNVGIGTTAPKSKMHALQGGAGTTPIANTVITAENSTASYISLLAPSTTETGIIFGHNTNAVSGGIIYNNPSFKNGFQFRTAGNITRMVLSQGGRLGIGDDPGIFKVKIVQDFGGLAIADIFGNTWEFGLGFPNGPLSLIYNGTAKGFFDVVSGKYFVLSDERRKTNIQTMPAVLKKISQLKPSVYQLKNSTDKKYYEGFIAQDVMKIFPGLVAHNTDEKRGFDTYMLDYDGFGVIAIKGIQELMNMNESKDAVIDSLKSEIRNIRSEMNEIKAMLLKSNQNNTPVKAIITTSLTDALLEQNVPNPFSNTTAIHYALPSKFTSAQLNIADNNGKAIKQIKLTSAGKGTLNINAFGLAAGTYHYTLIVNGSVVESKQMVIIK